MYIELFSYVEDDPECDAGEYLGYVFLEQEDVYIDVDNEKLMEEMEDLFSEPITSTDERTGLEKEIEPYTRKFFKNVLPLLVDYGIRGRLRDEEEVEVDAYLKRPIPPADEFEDNDEEEQEQNSIELSMEEMQRMERIEEDEAEIEMELDEEEDDGDFTMDDGNDDDYMGYR